MQIPIQDVTVKRVFERKTKQGDRYYQIDYEAPGDIPTIVLSADVNPNDIPIGVKGQALIEYKQDKATVFEFGRDVPKVGFFPEKFLSFKPYTQK